VAADVIEEYAAAPDARVEQDLVFAGLIGMIDPPRKEAKDAVARAKGAGIRPLMITGDHPRTAAVIAQELGITDDGRAITGASWRSCRKRNGPERSPKCPSTRASTPNTNSASSRRCGGMAPLSR
jgi:magnesium-transporting ATPase (P-type)